MTEPKRPIIHLPGSPEEAEEQARRDEMQRQAYEAAQAQATLIVSTVLHGMLANGFPTTAVAGAMIDAAAFLCACCVIVEESDKAWEMTVDRGEVAFDAYRQQREEGARRKPS
jgi:hypothetical protein